MAGAMQESSADSNLQRPPNIVVFLVDDLGWRDLSYAGSRFYRTPNIDRLAAGGVPFTCAYAPAPNCAPSRASLMTGQWTPRHGVFTVGSSARGKARNRKLVPIANRTDLDPDLTTLPELLDEAGYATACVGKWHLGADPTKHGFDVNVGGNASGSPRGGYFAPWNNADLNPAPEGTYLSDHLTEEALSFVSEHAEEPFFLYLSHYGVHTPLQAPDADRELFEDVPPDGGQANPTYAGMVRAVDRSLGRIIEHLDQLELTEQTLVVFTSDHGGHGVSTSNAPLRGSKGMLYEGGLRVPLVLSWPGTLAAGQECEEPVTLLDLFPTLLSVSGPPKLSMAAPMDGDNLMPWLTGSSEWAPRSLYWHFPAYLEAYRKGASPWRTTPAGALRSDGFKLIEWFEDGRVELYDLKADPGESQDLSGAHPRLAADLRAELHRWREQVGAPVPTEREPAFADSAE